MAAQDKQVTTPVYSEEDHQTWAALNERQSARIADLACQLYFTGFPKLLLNPKRLPDPAVMSEGIHSLTGWTLSDAQNEYLGPTEWFEHLYEYRFPVTNYIRRPNELDFTPLPDLFHEYFGHLAFFTDPYFADTAQMFGQLYLGAKNERQQLEISRLWWYTTEFGLIRESGRLKIIGAGLLSSTGELEHALKPETPRYEFDIRRAAETPSAVYSFHPAYFILDDVPHIRRIMADYARMEGIPEPKPPHGE
jgi:phenylalanine-4-hydroxylase